MRKAKLLSTVALALLFGAGAASAQGMSKDTPERAPAAQQSAPAEKLAPSIKSGEQKAPQTTGQATSDKLDKASDKAKETTESFLVKLSNPKGAITLGSNSTAIVSILDDDTPAGGGGNGSGSDGKGGGGGGGFGVAALAWLALLLYMRQGDLRLSRSNARSLRAGRPGRSCTATSI